MSKINLEISQILETCDIDSLIIKMRAYTIGRLGKDEKKYDGLEPLDFVFGVFEKALSGVRNWDNEKCTFELFVFGVLKSEISAFLTKKQRKKGENSSKGDEFTESYIIEIPDFPTEIESNNGASFEDLDHYIVQKNQYIKLLKEAEVTEMELMIFECLCDDIHKPQEIADFLEEDVKTVYNALKRLRNRKANILQKKI